MDVHRSPRGRPSRPRSTTSRCGCSRCRPGRCSVASRAPPWCRGRCGSTMPAAHCKTAHGLVRSTIVQPTLCCLTSRPPCARTRSGRTASFFLPGHSTSRGEPGRRWPRSTLTAAPSQPSWDSTRHRGRSCFDRRSSNGKPNHPTLPAPPREGVGRHPDAHRANRLRDRHGDPSVAAAVSVAGLAVLAVWAIRRERGRT